MNVVLYIDVMFVLLVIFMVIVFMIISGINVDFFQVNGNFIELKDVFVMVSLDKEGCYFFKYKIYSLVEFLVLFELIFILSEVQ